MTVVGDILSDQELEKLSRLHAEALPESLVSRLGPAYGRAFYRHVSRSTNEIAFVERCGSGREVAGACIVSLNPRSLNQRLLLGTPLLWHALRALPRLRHGATSAPQGPPVVRQPPGPEILFIFTQARLRSQGCGARLLGAAEAWLASRGFEKLFVKTRDAGDNRAITFYRRSGFRLLGPVPNRGKRLVLFDKQLSPGDAIKN